MYTLLRGKLTLHHSPHVQKATEDALWLAAAVPATPNCTTACEWGVGSGAASLSLLLRCPKLSITGFEICPLACSLAGENAQLNHMSQRLKVIEADVCAPHFCPPAAQHYFANPPYFALNSGHFSAKQSRNQAFMVQNAQLALWVYNLFAAAKTHNASLSILLHIEHLPLVQQALAEQHTIESTLFYLHSQPEKEAKRFIICCQPAATATSQHKSQRVDTYSPTLRKAVLEEGQSLNTALKL